MKNQSGEKKWRESAFQLSEIPGLTRPILEAIDAALSTSDKANSDDSAKTVSSLLDTFLTIVRNEENETAWNNLGFEVGNLALRILSAIERIENFQSNFCKLISSMHLICVRNAGAWRQLARPLLNIFTNKKLDYLYFKRSVKEFKNLSKCAESGEITRFTKQNLHLLQGFTMLAFQVGDFLFQMDVLEIVLIYTCRDKSLGKAVLAFGSESTRELMETLDFSDFQKDSRILLNELNFGFGARKRIFSINCNLVYFGNVALSAPLGTDGIWMDVNADSRKITIISNNFLSNPDNCQSVILKLPLSEIEKLKLEFGSVSGGECYCITIKIASLTEMYEFASGNSVVCTALSGKNLRDAVNDFIREIHELSPNIQEHPRAEIMDQWESKRTTGGYEDDQCVGGKFGASCTSPAVFSTSGSNKNCRKGEWKYTQMSRTSPLTLHTCSHEEIKTLEGKTGGGNEKEHKFPSVQHEINIQVNKFCSSRLQISPLCQSTNRNSLRGRIHVFKRKSSKLTLEKFRLEEDVITNTHKNKYENVQLEEKWENHGERERNASRICGDLACYREDLISTQEFRLEKENVENIEISEKVRGGEKEKKSDWPSVNTDGRMSTSLLDPNGYAFRRWLRPTTSARSNFWLEKIKGRQKTVPVPVPDIFHFVDEGDLSDDGIFQKEKIEEGKKLTSWTEKKCRRREKANENRQRSVGRKGKEGRAKITGGGRKIEGKLKFASKAKEPETNLRARSGIGLDIDKREIKVSVEVPQNSYIKCNRQQLPNKFEEVEITGDSSGEIKNRKKGSKGGKQLNTEGKAGIKRMLPTNIQNCCPSGSGPDRSNREITGEFEELNDIAARLSSGFEEWTQELIEWEVRQARKFEKDVMDRMKNLAEEEQHETENKSKRFELCIQYFTQGCSITGSGDYLQSEMRNVAETMNEVRGKGSYLGEKVVGLAERLKKTIAAGMRATFDKKMKLLYIQQLENILSCRGGNTFTPSEYIF